MLAPDLYDQRAGHRRHAIAIRISMLLSTFTDTFFRKTFKVSKSPSRYCTGKPIHRQSFHFDTGTPDRRTGIPPVSFYRYPERNTQVRKFTRGPGAKKMAQIHRQSFHFDKFTGKVFISAPRTPDRRTHRCKFTRASHGFASARPRHHPMAQNAPCVAV